MSLFTRSLFPFLWLLPPILSAQPIAGRVVDAETRRPLAGVNVSAAPAVGAVTDTVGRFDLDATGATALRFSYVGYATTRVPLNGRDSLVVGLVPTEQTLPQVVVTAYASAGPLAETAGPVGVLEAEELRRFDNTSLLAAVNTLPGVRMEERAAGSYRLSIRGSQLRARFDVRNVKVYWNDVPFTNPTGNTYLNLLDPLAFDRLEVLKGPSGSLYGAGTGGAVLFYSPTRTPEGTTAEFRATAGSYGLYRFSSQVRHTDERLTLQLTHARQHSNGYRANNSLDRDFTDLWVRSQLNERHALALHAWYADLDYGIPSGLTAQQVAEDPRQARPGSAEQRAGILNRTGQGALIWTFTPGERWSWTTSAYGRSTSFENPFLFDYDITREGGVGGRSRLSFRPSEGLRLQLGAEGQHGTERIRTYDINKGVAVDTALRQADNVATTQALAFGQADLALWDERLRLTAGISVNHLTYDLTRTAGRDPGGFEQRFDAVWSARLAVVARPLAGVTLHTSLSTGFSPPTLDEVRPSGGVLNRDLRAERGLNGELGLRLHPKSVPLYLDVTAFALRLNNTIVERQDDATGRERYRNTGSTHQRGLEALLTLEQKWEAGFVRHLETRLAYTGYRFTFEDYRTEAGDSTGNALPGVPREQLVTTFDLRSQHQGYFNLTLQQTGRVPLDDANTVYADAYAAVHLRLGWAGGRVGPFGTDLFFGINNLFDTSYSLGNDLNASGGRFFQPAAGRNLYGGIALRLFN